MRYRELGTTGVKASVVGLGTWVTGGGSVWGKEPDDAQSIRAIHAALDSGVNLIDTAPGYGWGRSEQVVGKAIQGRRDSVIVATKCNLIRDDDRGSPFAELNGKMVHRSLRPDAIVEEIERSLSHLDTDYIDLYQTHWPSVEPDILDQLDSWKELTEKYNCSLAQLTLAWTAAQPGVTHVLVGARNAQQAIENAAAADIELSTADRDRMRKNIESLGTPTTEAL